MQSLLGEESAGDLRLRVAIAYSSEADFVARQIESKESAGSWVASAG
jgi:hypothetical protein